MGGQPAGVAGGLPEAGMLIETFRRELAHHDAGTFRRLRLEAEAVGATLVALVTKPDGRVIPHVRRNGQDLPGFGREWT